MPPLTKDPQIVALIQAVSRNSSLYDYRLPNYNNNDESVWKSIAVECNLEDAEEAKTIWQKLNRAFNIFYRNELIRLVGAKFNENEIGPLPPEIKHDAADERFGTQNWGYYTDLSFIKSFRIKGVDSDLDRLIELARSIISEPNDKLEFDKKKNVVATTMENAQNRVETTMMTTTTTTTTTTTNLSTAEELPAHFDIPTLTMLSNEELCLFSFFDAMFRATRVLPSHLQRRVKRELLQSVHCAEADAEAEQ